MELQNKSVTRSHRVNRFFYSKFVQACSYLPYQDYLELHHLVVTEMRSRCQQLRSFLVSTETLLHDLSHTHLILELDALVLVDIGMKILVPVSGSTSR
jgi:hypothetical protein